MDRTTPDQPEKEAASRMAEEAVPAFGDRPRSLSLPDTADAHLKPMSIEGLVEPASASMTRVAPPPDSPVMDACLQVASSGVPIWTILDMAQMSGFALQCRKK